MRTIATTLLLSILSSLAIAAHASEVPGKPELAGISLGASWEQVSVAVGAERIRCTKVTDQPPMDNLCTFKLRKPPALGGLPLQEDVVVGLESGNVVYVSASVPKVDATGEARLLAALKKLSRAWHMSMREGNGEVLITSVDLSNRPAALAAREATLASITMLALGERDRTVSVHLGTFKMLVLMSEMAQR